MKKWLLGLALVLATKAGAATVDPTQATITSTSTAGRYEYNFGKFDPVSINQYTAWELRLLLNGNDIDRSIVGSIASDMQPSYASMLFDTKESAFTVTGVLTLFKNAVATNPTTYQRFYFIIESYGDSSTIFKREASFGTQPAQLRAAEAAVVPIGGTLPLMLTAIGLGGWLLRSRGKAA